MTFDPERKARLTYAKVMAGGDTKPGPDGNPIHVLGSSQAEAIAGMRAMLIPPAPAGSADDPRDDLPYAEPEYRRTKNRLKANRRSRRRERSQRSGGSN